jgi:hypothetical protein
MLPDLSELASSLNAPTDQPKDATFLVTGVEGEFHTLVSFPRTGTVWVSYDWGDEPAEDVCIWHQDATTTEIPEGEGLYAVRQGDCLMWTLASPTNLINIGWGYV